MAKLKNPYVCKKNTFSASNIFMHILNMSVTCLQSADEKIQWRLSEELISQSMYYLS